MFRREDKIPYSLAMGAEAKITPQFPQWASAMQPGHWFRISGNAPDLNLAPTAIGTRYLEDNDPALDPALNPPMSLKERARRLVGRDWIAPWSGRMGLSSITEAWNGAVYASRAGPSGAMIVFGGGHNDYFGSDVHAFDLAHREWRRLTTGFTSGRPDEYGEAAIYPDAVYPDNSPLPPHTYDYVQYDEVGNDFILLKGQTELGPNVKAVAIPHLFNLDTLTWRRGPQHRSAILNSGGFTTWDGSRRVLWGHSGDDGGGNAFVAYSPDGVNPDGTVGMWREFHPSKLQGEANHNAMQIHPDADSILVAIHPRDSLGVIDPKYPGEAIAPVKSCGAKPQIQEYAALEYSMALRSLVYYSAADGAAVYAIDWDGEARWHALSAPSSLDPVPDAAALSRHHVNRAHTFGRFRIAHFDDADLAILVRHVDSPVYAMRLSRS
jgi:hypothetical protein